MKCERCGIGFRNEAGEPCSNCGYPFDGPQEGDTRSAFDRFLDERSVFCPIAYMIWQMRHLNPAVTPEQLMMLALSNYSAKADNAARLIEDFARMNARPQLRVV